MTIEAERIEASQARGYWVRRTRDLEPHTGYTAAEKSMLGDAYDRGFAGERPDANAIAKAHEDGRKEVLDVVQRIYERAQRECNEAMKAKQNNTKPFMAAALANALLEAVTIKNTCDDILYAARMQRPGDK